MKCVCWWFASLPLHSRTHKSKQWWIRYLEAHLICFFKFDKTSEWNCLDMMCSTRRCAKTSENYCHERNTFSDDEWQTHFVPLAFFSSSYGFRRQVCCSTLEKEAFLLSDIRFFLLISYSGESKIAFLCKNSKFPACFEVAELQTADFHENSFLFYYPIF